MTNESLSSSNARLPWVASSLSLCCPGLGQIYCGRAGRGLIHFGLLGLFGPSVGTILVATSFPPLVLFGGVLLVLFLSLVCWSAFDARRIAISLSGQEYVLRDFNRMVIYLLLVLASLLYAVGLALLVRANVVEAFYIPTNSMSPTLVFGDRILANKLGVTTRTFIRGDVIVFRNPENRRQIFVKRIVGLPGDTVEFTGRELLVNGVVQHQLSQATPETSGASPQASKQTVPLGSYFVLGDNRNLSHDSRHFGFLSHGEITGVVTLLYWPSQSWSRFGRVSSLDPRPRS